MGLEESFKFKKQRAETVLPRTEVPKDAPAQQRAEISTEGKVIVSGIPLNGVSESGETVKQQRKLKIPIIKLKEI